MSDRRQGKTNLYDVLQALVGQAYTGQVVIHWKDGRPMSVDTVSKKTVHLTDGASGPTLESRSSASG